MKKILENLLKIKSLVTIAVVAVFVWCAVTGGLTTENIMVVVTMIITFYFTKKGGGDDGRMA